jgi:hypothetical protein
MIIYLSIRILFALRFNVKKTLNVHQCIRENKKPKQSKAQTKIKNIFLDHTNIQTIKITGFWLDSWIFFLGSLILNIMGRQSRHKLFFVYRILFFYLSLDFT